MAAKKPAKADKAPVSEGSSIQEEKLKALEHALADLDKQFGKGAVMKMGADAVNRDIPVIPTGCLTLDYALGVGGIPRGRIVEIYGPESSGKTTVALHVVAEAQRAGGIAAFVDAEHALDPLYAKKLGVKIDELYVSQPDTGEQALEITEALVRSGALDVVVIDSVAALVPKAEIDGEMGDSFGEKVGVMYGNPETTPGGRALKFYSSVRLDVRKGEALKNGSEIIGNHTKVKVVKNKVAPPFRVAEFDIIYGEGISKEGTLLDMAVEYGIITKSGAFFSYGDQRLAQGRDNARVYLREHPELTAEIDQKVRAILFAPKDMTPDEAKAVEAQKQEEEDDLALLDEDI